MADALCVFGVVPWLCLAAMSALCDVRCARPPPPADEALDEPPRARDGPIITPTVAKSILGQAGLQLAVLAALLGPLGEALVDMGAQQGAAAHAAAAAVAAAGDVAAVGLSPERACQYTLVFNSFVLMQLFNQVGAVRRPGPGASHRVCTTRNNSTHAQQAPEA